MEMLIPIGRVCYRWVPASADCKDEKYNLICKKQGNSSVKVRHIGTFLWKYFRNNLACGILADTGQEYVIKMGSIFKSVILLREFGQNDRSIAQMRIKGENNEGVLECCTNNSKYRWLMMDILENEWGFFDREGKILLRIKGSTPKETGAEVTMAVAMKQDPMLYILLFMGWYSILLLEEYNGVTAASAHYYGDADT